MMDRIMIIVPHEDDEILMAAGIIEKAVKEKKQITVVMATNGDYEGTDKISGSVRLRETLAGLEVLGAAADKVIFMGYADTGMDPTESFIYRLYAEQEEDRLHPGNCSDETYGLPEKPDYHSAKYGIPASYCRRNFKADLREIMEKECPDAIFTTSLEDMHGDHSGLFLFVKEILEEGLAGGCKPVLYSSVVHSRAGDENWPLRLKAGSAELPPFTCPEGFDTGSLKWEDRIRFPLPECMLSADFLLNKKAKALSMHKNALKEDAVEYLYSFMKAEEIFWKISY